MSLTKRDIVYWLRASELTGNDYFIKKLSNGHYRVSFDRAKHLSNAAQTLGHYFGVKHGPSVVDMWIEVMPKSKLYGVAKNPRKRRSKKIRRNCGCKVRRNRRRSSYRRKR